MSIQTVKTRLSPANRFQLKQFPNFLLGIAFIFDLIARLTMNSNWSELAFWIMAAGLVLGFLVAAIANPQLQWLEVENLKKARLQIQDWVQLLALSFFCLGWLVRRELPEAPSVVSMVLAGVGFAFLVGNLRDWSREKGLALDWPPVKSKTMPSYP